jgi:hypothetical protein
MISKIPDPLIELKALVALLRSSTYTQVDDGDDSSTVVTTAFYGEGIRIKMQPREPVTLPRWRDMSPLQQSFYRIEGVNFLVRNRVEFGAGSAMDDDPIDARSRLHPALAPWGYVPTDEQLQAGIKADLLEGMHP